MKLTKCLVDKLLPHSIGNQIFYRDDQLKGFALRVTQNAVKSFVVEKLIAGKLKRITIGRYGELTVEQARKEAQKILGQIATGIDPVAEKKQQKLKSITLQTVFDDYLKTRKDLKSKTRYDYERIITHTAFSDWKSKSLLSITKDKIVRRHTLLGEERGKAYANLSMRVLRAVFNFAAGQYEDSQGKSLVLENPVKRLSQTRAWFRHNRRLNYIKPSQLSDWFNAVNQLENEIIRDYLLLVIFTGLRRNEAAKLEKNQVDLINKTLTIEDTKNRQTHVLPLTDYLCDILKNRMTLTNSNFIFQGFGKTGYIIEPRKQIARIIKETDIQFTVHDLRRTFITIAEGLDISAYALKRLINHRMSNDVTAGYIITDVERLRKPMQQICDYILTTAQNFSQPTSSSLKETT